MYEKDEYSRIADAARDYLELMLSSGVDYLPVHKRSARPLADEALGADAETVAREAGALSERVMECRACVGTLSKTPTGAGPASSALVFVCGSPALTQGAAEQGLLTKMIEAMGFDRGSVYVTNSVRCSFADGPTDEVIASCKGFLEDDLAALAGAKVVVALGAEASYALLGRRDVAELRGRFHELGGIKVMPTYGVGEMLKDPSLKKPAWDDLRAVIKELGKP